MTFKKLDYDVFISHAVEDKIGIANELCERLQTAGLKVWYSGIELNAGDNIEDAIQNGLERSRFGVVILSKTYLDKNWTIKEYFNLKGKERPGHKVVFPVLFGTTVEDLILKDLEMAGVFALNFDRLGMDRVVEKLLQAIQKTADEDYRRHRRRMLEFFLGISLLALFASAIYWFAQPKDISNEMLRQAVESRIKLFEQRVDNRLSTLKAAGATLQSLQKVDSVFRAFNNTKSYYRNEFEFDNGLSHVKAKKNVESRMGVDLDQLSPANAYLLPDAMAFMMTSKEEGRTHVRFAIVALQPLHFTPSTSTLLDDGSAVATVTYQNPLRYIEVALDFPQSENDIRKHHVEFFGFQAKEAYVLERKGDNWVITGSK